MRAKLTILIDYEPSEHLSEVEEREEAHRALSALVAHASDNGLLSGDDLTIVSYRVAIDVDETVESLWAAEQAEYVEQQRVAAMNTRIEAVQAKVYKAADELKQAIEDRAAQLKRERNNKETENG